jgi:flagellar biosynthetic protein FliR
MDELRALTALTSTHLITFVLVFTRMAALTIFAPVFGHRAVPVTERAALALLFSLVLTPVVSANAGRPPDDAASLVLAVAGELFVGLVIGFLASLVMAAVESAGDLVSTQMGLSLSSVFDPSTGSQTSVIGRFQHLLAVLLFLSLNGHHLLVQATAGSFRRMRPGAFLAAADTSLNMVKLGGKLFRSGLELAAPLVGILLIVNVALALLARVAPQTNVFMLGIPITIVLGLAGLSETFPFFLNAVGRLTTQLGADLDVVLNGALHGGR